MPLSKSALWRKEVRDVYAEGGYTLTEAAKQASRRRRVRQQPKQVRQQPIQVQPMQVRQQPIQVQPMQVRQQQPQQQRIPNLIQRGSQQSEADFLARARAQVARANRSQQPTSLIPIRQQPQPAMRVKAPRKPKVYRPITIQEARAAFDAYYTAENRTRPSKIHPEGRLRFNNAERSKAYDTNYTSSHVISDERYLRNPRKYDFLGVDTGPKIRTNRKV